MPGVLDVLAFVTVVTPSVLIGVAWKRNAREHQLAAAAVARHADWFFGAPVARRPALARRVPRARELVAPPTSVPDPVGAVGPGTVGPDIARPAVPATPAGLGWPGDRPSNEPVGWL